LQIALTIFEQNNLQITYNLPGGNGVTWGKSGNGVTWGRNMIKSFSADSKFPVGYMWELIRGKIENVLYPTTNLPVPNNRQTKAGRGMRAAVEQLVIM
jgi:hypothetical protein